MLTALQEQINYDDGISNERVIDQMLDIPNSTVRKVPRNIHPLFKITRLQELQFLFRMKMNNRWVWNILYFGEAHFFSKDL